MSRTSHTLDCGCRACVNEWIDLADDLEAKVKELTKNLEWAKQLLGVALCPHCDGSGTVIAMCGDTPEPEQCQWCHERSYLPPDKENSDE